MRSSFLFVFLAACAPAAVPPGTMKCVVPPAPVFDDEVRFLERFAPIVVLSSDGAGRVAVAPALQGRVMTSAVSEEARPLGWVNHAFLESRKHGTQFDNYGGEDRFWLGPEGGQFGLYFKPGAPYVFSVWQTPSALNEGEWTVGAKAESSIVLTRSMEVKNHSGTVFDVAAVRTVRVLSRAQAGAALGMDIPGDVQIVAFETENKITNAGQEPWTKATGLLSIWILGMYAPEPDAHVVLPFDPSAAGAIVNDAYFGKVPKDRLSVHPDQGYLSFVCDGAYRSKIGMTQARARSPLASYSPSARLLTLIQYDKPSGAADYVNSMWEEQKDPYSGDVINSYNDGPTEPGKPSLGGFYEIESSSPGAALAPGASIVHIHRTFHLVGGAAALETITRKVRGLRLADFAR